MLTRATSPSATALLVWNLRLPVATKIRESGQRARTLAQSFRKKAWVTSLSVLSGLFVMMSIFTPRALALEVLHVTGYDPRGTTILKAKQDSLLKEGDVVLQAQHQPLERLEELDWLLSDVGPGKPFVLEVQREGAVKLLSLTMPKLTDVDREEHVRLSLGASP